MPRLGSRFRGNDAGRLCQHITLNRTPQRGTCSAFPYHHPYLLGRAGPLGSGGLVPFSAVRLAASFPSGGRFFVLFGAAMSGVTGGTEPSTLPGGGEPSAVKSAFCSIKVLL